MFFEQNGRLEVFSGFTNAIFLIFVAIFTVIEAGWSLSCMYYPN